MEKKVGRPPGREFTERMELPLRPGTKDSLQNLAEQYGTNRAALVRALIENLPTAPKAVRAWVERAVRG